jgi:hypothetical protein
MSNAEKTARQQTGVAAPARPQPTRASSAPAEASKARTTAVTPSHSDGAKLLPEVADYSQHTNEQLHKQNVNNLDEFKRKREDVENFAYDVLLPGFNAAIERIKRGEVLNGCTEVAAYFESIGFKYATVRKWKQRFYERTFKPLLNAAPGKPETLTPEQRELRDALTQQGYRPPEAIRFAKAAQGNSFMERFKWVMVHRADEIHGTEPATKTVDPAPAHDAASVTTETEATPSMATFVYWERSSLPAPKFEHSYFAQAADNFKHRYGRALRGTRFTNILGILRNTPRQVLANAHDFAQLAVLLRGAANHLNLLAAVITNSLSSTPPTMDVRSNTLPEQNSKPSGGY